MYFKVLGLHKEPFSTSPDPDFLFLSPAHDTALKRLEIQIRLKRGFSLVFGDVGTGKTTISRALVRQFAEEKDVLFFLMLDPSARDEAEFVGNVATLLGLPFAGGPTLGERRRNIERFLFKTAFEQRKTVVLLIDEGQKIAPENLEVLRTLLNFETNEYKLLQLAIFAQLELLPRIASVPNLIDRASLKYVLNTLDEDETAKLIRFRLVKAGYRGEKDIFSSESAAKIFRASGGYPRKIAVLCHEALERAVMRDTPFVTPDIIDDILRERGDIAQYLQRAAV
jgi:general secretion pathway protein A